VAPALGCPTSSAACAVRSHLRKRGIGAEIPVPPTSDVTDCGGGSRGGRAPAFDRETCKQRTTVERCINRLKQWRGIATRQTATSCLAGPTSRAPFSGLFGDPNESA
jgi:transposase